MSSGSIESSSSLSDAKVTYFKHYRVLLLLLYSRILGQGKEVIYFWRKAWES